MEMAGIGLDRLLFYKQQSFSRIPLYVIQRWTRGALYGLEYLNQVGVVHRDLKLSNILIHSRSNDPIDLRNARFLIADFGSAQKPDVE